MKTTNMNYTPIQLKLPVDLARIIKINDAVYSFSEVMAHIDRKKYFVEKEHETGRPRYDREKLLKIVLFAFMEFGCCSVRFIQIQIPSEEDGNAKSGLNLSTTYPQETQKSLRLWLLYAFQSQKCSTPLMYFSAQRRLYTNSSTDKHCAFPVFQSHRVLLVPHSKPCWEDFYTTIC